MRRMVYYIHESYMVRWQRILLVDDNRLSTPGQSIENCPQQERSYKQVCKALQGLRGHTWTVALQNLLRGQHLRKVSSTSQSCNLAHPRHSPSVEAIRQRQPIHMCPRLIRPAAASLFCIDLSVFGTGSTSLHPHQFGCDIECQALSSNRPPGELGR